GRRRGGQGLEARNMTLLCRSDLSGRGNGGEGLGMTVGGGRRVLYIAHESAPVNFSAVDVTDPRAPRVLCQVELPHPGVRSNSLSVEGDLLAVAYQVAEAGMQPAGMELFDVSDPQSPRSVGFFDTSGPHSRGAHFVWLSGGRAYLSSGMPGFEPRHPKDHQIVVIVDVEHPDRPQEIGRWWLPGVGEGDQAPAPERHPVFDGGFRPHNLNVYPERADRAYVGYLDAGVVVLDISDPARPRQVSRLDYHPPLPGFTHTVLPLLDRGLLAVTDEANRPNAEDHPKLLWLMDMSCEPHLAVLGTAPLPPVEEQRHRGGRFGAHNLHENDPSPAAWRSQDVVVGTFFNAGVRAFDVTDPFHPSEVAHLVPDAPPGSPAGAIQMNDVFVDDRGIVHAVDRCTGGLYEIEAGW
ncbi:MAG: LVIVD repeat-containing protein, partial [Acidimicrobiales bacterium]